MSKQQEAMRLALEALVRASSYYDTYAEIAALEAAMAEPVQEPVYWEVRCTAHPKWMRVDEQQFDEYVSNGWEGQRLYAAPPQRKPLTEEEIIDLWAGVSDPESPDISMIAFARAIERAHWIGGNDD